MLTIYDSSGTGLRTAGVSDKVSDGALWLDLMDPTEDEQDFVEKALGIELPTRAEMREIEPSNRFYFEDGAYFLTAVSLHNIDAGAPSTSALTFILAGNRLVTLRFVEPKAFPLFVQRAGKGDMPCDTAAAIMIGLIETLVHRMADLIERIHDDVEQQAQSIFALREGRAGHHQGYDRQLRGIGRTADMTARAEESAASFSRLLHYFAQVSQERKDDTRIRKHIKAAQRDINSFLDHTRFLSGRIGFLLDATLGMINTEQNQIIKLFSVMAVILLPPTLVASVYGMNFKYMPELELPFGYPMALGLMAVAAFLPYLYFRRKGWL